MPTADSIYLFLSLDCIFSYTVAEKKLSPLTLCILENF